MNKKIKKYFEQLMLLIHKICYKKCYHPAYRLLEISEDISGEYHAKIQLINKNKIFSAKPEEILENDDLVSCFSPCDIRALTYLGYLGVNKPKYKILAKRLSQKTDKIFFSIRKKGETKIFTKTAIEIMNQMDVKKDFDSADSQTIGYVVALESLSSERNELQKALNTSN